MVRIVAKPTKNPKMFALTGDNNVTHLLQGRTKLGGLGMTVEEYFHAQHTQGITNDETETDNQPA